MDPAVLTALIAAGGAIAGGTTTAPIIIHVLSRRQRTVQADESAARTEQLEAQTEEIRQRLTRDLHVDLERVQSSLRTTSAEAEQLRRRVLDLESRVAQLTRDEARASEELRRTQAERDSLRTELAARDATIRELRGQVTTLTLQAALVQPPGLH